ncbi:hypothetical protein ACFYZ0_02545 [Streptomyces sp. NPDC001708]|uniref:hypothetical protein n=1 Tax=Streptomyces sp. NPDC001708 TaxID=3364602 RepID=UPI003675F187
MTYETNPQLGEEIGYAVGETVELATNYWAGAVGDEGDKGKILRFAFDGRDIFAYVLVDNEVAGTQPFPLLPSEIKKVEGGE